MFFQIKPRKLLTHSCCVVTKGHHAYLANLPVNNKKKNFMAPFYAWGSTASRLQPLRGGSLLFTTRFPEIPGTHFIDLGRMKG